MLRNSVLRVSDFNELLLTDSYTDTDTGVTHLYFAQRVNSLTVLNTSFTVTVTSAGRILNVAGGFVPGVAASTIATMPTISAAAAATATQVARAHVE